MPADIVAGRSHALPMAGTHPGSPRRRSLLGALALATPLLAHRSAGALERPTFVHGFGEGSTTGVLTRFAAAVVLFKAGTRPWVTAVPGDQGFGAFTHFQSPSAGDNAFLVADTMTLMLNAVRRRVVEPVLAMEPIVKLTNGISLALVASGASAVERLEDIPAAGRRRILRIAHAGRWSAAGVPLAWMMPSLPPVKELVCSGNDTVLKAVGQDAADLGLVITNALPRALRDGADLRPLATFGAERSPHFPQVRTFAEIVRDPKKSFTSSFSLFAKPNARRQLDDVLVEAFARPLPPKLLLSLDWLAQNIVVNDHQTVRDTVRRDLRVAMSAASQLAPT